MNVLHMIKGLGPGGAETLLRETLKHHDRCKYSFYYIYFLPWKDQLAEDLRRLGGSVACFESRNNLSILTRAGQVRSYIEEHGIDILHCHLPWTGVLGRIVHRLTGIPTVYTEHNEQSQYHPITRRLNSLTFDLQSAAIAVSSAVASSIRESIAPSIPLHEISNGVDVSSFTRSLDDRDEIRRALNVGPDEVLVGTTAVFRPQKRLVEWLDVFSEAARDISNLTGVIVGDGPEMDGITRRRRELGLEQRVALPGRATDVKPWLSAMDIYMMTSLHEGMPVALLEAMSMGCAVCATGAGGIKDVLEDGKNGIVVGVDDLKSLPGKLKDLASDRARRSGLSESARRTVETRYSTARMVAELEELYTRLAAGK